MSNEQIIRAWRDESYWLGLSDSQRASVPANPAGQTELMDVELERVVAGTVAQSGVNCTAGHCSQYTCDHCNFTAYSGGLCCD